MRSLISSMALTSRDGNKKMLFYMTTMNLANITREDVPKATTDPPTREMLLTIEAWMQSDFLCRNYILNRLENNLYDIYSSYKTTKEVWEMLEKKYKTEDAGANLMFSKTQDSIH